MKFGYTIVYVPDVEAAVAFYERAFGSTRQFIAPDATYAQLETGDTALGFAANELARSNLPLDFQPNRPDAPPAGIELAFTTDDVAGAYAHAVAQGAAPVAEARTKPWGQTVAYVRDLNGVLVEIASPM